MKRFCLSSFFLFVTLAACGGNTDSGDDGSGSGPCGSWRKAICDFAARCGTDATTCRQQVPSITCASDTQATECANKLNAAACSSPPSGCDLSDLADVDVARAGCNDFVEALCGAGQRCGSGLTIDQCRADLLTQGIDCDQAVGVAPSLQECLDALASLSCDATATPAPCENAVLVGQ